MRNSRPANRRNFAVTFPTSGIRAVTADVSVSNLRDDAPGHPPLHLVQVLDVESREVVEFTTDPHALRELGQWFLEQADASDGDAR